MTWKEVRELILDQLGFIDTLAAEAGLDGSIPQASWSLVQPGATTA